MYDVHSVPLIAINVDLADKKEEWRARIVDDQFEFYIPKN